MTDLKPLSREERKSRQATYSNPECTMVYKIDALRALRTIDLMEQRQQKLVEALKDTPCPYHCHWDDDEPCQSTRCAALREIEQEKVR